MGSRVKSQPRYSPTRTKQHHHKLPIRYNIQLTTMAVRNQVIVADGKIAMDVMIRNQYLER